MAVVQYTYTHKQYRERHKTNNTYNNIKIDKTTQKYIEQHKNLEECGPCPVFAGFTFAFALQLRVKGKGKVATAPCHEVSIVEVEVQLHSFLNSELEGGDKWT